MADKIKPGGYAPVTKDSIADINAKNRAFYGDAAGCGMDGAEDCAMDANILESKMNEGPVSVGGMTFRTLREYVEHLVKNNGLSYEQAVRASLYAKK